MSKDPLGLNRPTIPVAYALLMLEVLEERGVPRDEVLGACRLPAHLLERGDARLTATQWTRLCLDAIRLSGDEGLGYEYGLRLKPSAHGFLGFAAMTGQTLREAVSLAEKYFRLRLRQYQLHVAFDGDRAVLELQELQRIPVLRQFFCEMPLVGMTPLFNLIGESRPDLELWFEWPQPAYYARYKERLPRVRFNQPANQFRFPAAYLDRRLLLADAAAHQQALVQVQREYDSVKQGEGGTAARVRAELTLLQSGYPSLTQLAKKLCASERTLRRKLGDDGTRYQVLLDEVRYRDARTLLETSDLDLQAISARLGFGNPANFTRAFRKWSGTTPSDFRARSKPSA
jgi:AraC-like DNA-binding protein